MCINNKIRRNLKINRSNHITQNNAIAKIPQRPSRRSNDFPRLPEKISPSISKSPTSIPSFLILLVHKSCTAGRRPTRAFEIEATAHQSTGMHLRCVARGSSPRITSWYGWRAVRCGWWRDCGRVLAHVSLVGRPRKVVDIAQPGGTIVLAFEISIWVVGSAA